jgi:hypothetical protein
MCKNIGVKVRCYICMLREFKLMILSRSYLYGYIGLSFYLLLHPFCPFIYYCICFKIFVTVLLKMS